LSLGITSNALGSGWPPFTRGDSATVTRGGTISVLDTGSLSVLDNDIDIENDRLTAVLTRDVKHGELTLNEDGTFSYKNNGDNKKDDEFRYRAFDGTGFSREARVRIKIEGEPVPPNNPPFTNGAPPDQEAIESIPFLLALAGYFGDIDADDSLRFSAKGLPKGGRLKIDSTSGLLAGTPNGSDVRDAAYSIEITATDNHGASASLEFLLTIFSDARADLSLTARVSVNPVVVGEATSWEINIENRGPADLDEGELVATWTTSGPNLSLVAPQDCTLSANNSSTPSLRCSINGLSANTTRSFNVQGTQNGDGDNTLIAIAVSDDPNQGNNAGLTGAQVVTAFSEGPTQILSLSGGGVASGDLDGDGMPDVVISSDNTIVFFNSGNRTVTTPGQSLGTNSGGKVVVLLDWDGDGDTDIAVGGMSGKAGRVYFNNGSGSFSNGVDLNISGLGTVAGAAKADFDLDGDDDLVLVGSGNAIQVRRSGESGFVTSSLPASSGIHVAATDINNDSFPDIVIVEAGSRSVKILRNSGNGQNFNTQTLQRGSVASATPADVDGDGDIDLLLAVDDGELAVPESKVLYQQSAGSFSAGTTLGVSPVSQLLAGDLDGDALLDIVAMNNAGVHQLYRGLASGGFSLQAEQIVSDGMRRGVLRDFNGDGSLDLIVAGSLASVVEIHANNGKGRLGLGDRMPPTITLLGGPILNLAAGEPFVDEGATAIDDIDGDVTASIVLSGTVNTTVVGTYRVTYTATDRASNSAIVQRTVNVGVNQGTGGGGGGAVSLLSLLLLSGLLYLSYATSRQRCAKLIIK
jgi:VCBS repeat-containing protein